MNAGKKRKHSDDLEDTGSKRKHEEGAENDSNKQSKQKDIVEKNVSEVATKDTEIKDFSIEEPTNKELSVRLVPESIPDAKPQEMDTIPEPKQNDRIPTPVRELQELYATSVGERTRRKSKPMTYNEDSDDEGGRPKNDDSDSDYKPKESVRVESAQTEKVFGKLISDKQLVVSLNESGRLYCYEMLN